jgi:hypothetical protein
VAAAAAAEAVAVNPVNAPAQPAALVGAGILAPEHIALLTSRYWGQTGRVLTVRFMERTSYALKHKILEHMNAWYTGGAGIQFILASGAGTHTDVRVTLAGEGYWSYLGTDIRLIPQDEPTMCLQGFTLATPESEYRRVVRHEAGHTLGFPHEHMRHEVVARIDPRLAYAYFARSDGWDQQTVDAQVLTALEDRKLFFTSRPDVDSIMCYQLPGSITRDGQPIRGGTNIDRSDQEFANLIYPGYRP